jgi:replication-associated recombination protein RarA
MVIPLAEQLRPSGLDEYIGQEHLVGRDAILYKAIKSGNVPSMILWGPPGVGKTTHHLPAASAFVLHAQRREFRGERGAGSNRQGERKRGKPVSLHR